MATLVAALIGTIVTMIASGPFSLLALFNFPMLLAYLVLAAVLASPVTLALFPLTYLSLRFYPILVQLLIPLVGFVGGGAVVLLWIEIGYLPRDWQIFSGIGMISGLIAGAFFARGLFA
jgi:hypothetical protein